MKKLIAFFVGLLIFFGSVTSANAIWLDENHWVDETYAIQFKGKVAHWWIWDEDFGRMYNGSTSANAARKYIDHWYYLHSI